MFLEINPTTTLAALAINTTSAADSFQGLSNGVAKPGNVSDVAPGIPQPLFVHDVDWWDELGKSHIHIGYTSSDPAYVGRQVAAFQRQGIAGATCLWNGVGGMQDKACLAKRAPFAAAGLEMAIMLSSTIPTLKNATSIATRTAALNSVLDYLRANFFKSPAYQRLNGRPLLYCFGLANGDYDWNAVRAHAHSFGADEPLFAFRFEIGYSQHFCADMYFAWTGCTEDWVTAAKKMAKPLILAANGGFNNSLAGWGTPNVIPQQGGQRLQQQLAVSRNHPECPVTQGVTWNDYEEGTALEPGLASGVTVTLSESDGVLSWTVPGAAFDRCDLYFSADGKGYQPLAISRGVQSVDLKALEFAPGSYSFVVHAIGKPMVQSVLSNVVTATEAWS